MASINKSKLSESAQKFLAKGQVDKALKEYDKILDADPGDANIRLKTGDLRERLGQKDQAVADYRRVADKFRAEGFYSKAVAVLKRALSVDPNLVEVHLDLADLNHKLGLLSEVVHHYQIAANIHDRCGQKRQAIDILKKAADVGVSNVDRKMKVAELYYKEGFPDAGFEQIVHLLADLDPKSTELVPLLQRLCKAYPDDPRLKLKLVEAHLAQGNAKLGLEIIEQALAQRRDGRAVELLADIRMDDPAEEKTLLTEALNLYRAEGNSAKVRELSDRVDRQATSPVAKSEPEPIRETESTPVREVPSAPPAPPCEALAVPTPALDDHETSEQDQLESSLSEADVCLKYGQRDRAIALLEKLAARHPHRHEAPLRLRSIYESAGEHEAVAVQCRRLARVADARNDMERATRFLAEAEEAEARVGNTVVPQPGPEPVATPPQKRVPIPEAPAIESRDVQASALEIGDIEIVIEDPGLAETIEIAAPATTRPQAPPAGVEDLEIRLDDEPPTRPRRSPLFPETLAAPAQSDELILDDAFAEQAAAPVVAPPSSETLDGDDLDFRLDEEAPSGVASAPTEKIAPSPHEPSASSIEDQMILEESVAETQSPAEAIAIGVSEERDIAPELSEQPAARTSIDLEEANFYASQGMFEEAIEIYQRAVRANPRDKGVAARLEALLRERAGPIAKEVEKVIVSADHEAAMVDRPSPEEALLDLDGLDFPEEIVLEGVPAPKGTEERVCEEARAPAAAEPPLCAKAPPCEEEPSLDNPEWIHDHQGAAEEEIAANEALTEESDFDLRAELEDEIPDGQGENGGVSAATEALSELVQELQSLEEEEVPGSPEAQAHYDLGIAYKEMGLLDDAVRELRIASRDPQRWFECRTVLGICYREQGNPDDAIREFEQSLADPRITGHDPTALFYEMALAQEDMGNPEEALRWHERVAEIDPVFRDVRMRIAVLCDGRNSGRKGPPGAHHPEEGGAPEPAKRDRKKKISYL